MKKEHLTIGNISVEVWRTSVKNLNLAVYAPDGRVRISVPHLTSKKLIHRAVMNRMAWIQEQRTVFQSRPIPALPQIVTGEEHLFFGEKYPLTVIEGSFRHFVNFEQETGITLNVRTGTTAEGRLRVLDNWYRDELKSRIPELLAIWQPQVGREVKEYRIKKMKTRWGTCNIIAHRLWLNLELAKKPQKCMELIVVHELVHLLEREHNKNFYAHMDRLLPEWRSIDNLLKDFE